MAACSTAVLSLIVQADHDKYPVTAGESSREDFPDDRSGAKWQHQLVGAHPVGMSGGQNDSCNHPWCWLAFCTARTIFA